MRKHTRKAATLSQRIKLDDNCDETLSSAINEYTSITLEAYRNYCLNTTGFFLIGSKGAKISYEKEDGTFTAQTSDALGATSELQNNELTSRKYQIVVSEDQECTLVTFNYSSSREQSPYGSFYFDLDEKAYAVLKTNFEGKISTNYQLKGNNFTGKATSICFFNPNGATISAKNEANSTTSYNDEDLTTSQTNQKLGFFLC